MKSHYINLFRKKNQAIIVSTGMRQTKKITLRVILLLLVIMVSMYGLRAWIQEQINTLERQKDLYATFIDNNKNIEKEIILLHKRKEYLKRVLKDDINFRPYYTILNGIVDQPEGATASNSSVIQNIEFSYDTSTTITFESANEESSWQLIRRLESSETIGQFDQLVINGIVYNGLQEDRYQLYAEGKLKNLTP